MNNFFAPRLLIALSVLYGATIAILGILRVDFVGMFAAIGGVVIGVLWALRAVLGSSGTRHQ
jgi:hypothetical protein